jgi:hypothetical protein
MSAHPAPPRRPIGAFGKVLLVVLAVMCAIACALGLLFFSAIWLVSDEPEEPEIQPLEVVVNSSTVTKRPCLLNVDQVRAGDHAVVVIGESGYAKVHIVDEGGRVVFRTDNEGQRIETDEDGDVTIVQGEGEGEEGPAAHLDAGTFKVVCRPESGEPGEATLEVLRARPGH